MKQECYSMNVDFCLYTIKFYPHFIQSRNYLLLLKWGREECLRTLRFKKSGQAGRHYYDKFWQCLTWFFILKVVSLVLQKTTLVDRFIDMTHAFLLIICLLGLGHIDIFISLYSSLFTSYVVINRIQESFIDYSSLFPAIQVALSNF